MNFEPIQIKKIVYSSINKNYKIIFNGILNLREFIINLSPDSAKNIAMASEGITSKSLSQYDLLINLIDLIEIKIKKITIMKNNNILYTTIHFQNKNNCYKINSNITDAIILSLITYSTILIDENLLEKDSLMIDRLKLKDDSNQFIKSNNKSEKYFSYRVEKLKKILEKCIENENYESAAVIRDKIKLLDKENNFS